MPLPPRANSSRRSCAIVRTKFSAACTWITGTGSFISRKCSAAPSMAPAFILARSFARRCSTTPPLSSSRTTIRPGSPRPARPTNSSRAVCAMRSRWSTSACSITSSSATTAACRLRNADSSDSPQLPVVAGRGRLYRASKSRIHLPIHPRNSLRQPGVEIVDFAAVAAGNPVVRPDVHLENGPALKVVELRLLKAHRTARNAREHCGQFASLDLVPPELHARRERRVFEQPGEPWRGADMPAFRHEGICVIGVAGGKIEIPQRPHDQLAAARFVHPAARPHVCINVTEHLVDEVPANERVDIYIRGISGRRVRKPARMQHRLELVDVTLDVVLLLRHRLLGRLEDDRQVIDRRVHRSAVLAEIHLEQIATRDLVGTHVCRRELVYVH